MRKGKIEVMRNSARAFLVGSTSVSGPSAGGSDRLLSAKSRHAPRLIELMISAADAGNHRPQFASEEATYLASFSFARTSSMLKVGAFCRGGKSRNVATNWPT